uniref:Uncharacterized protein n=1 Tax=Cacopsylla melanoneura TaxID=428564 RepID=A0A8D8RHU2_9HEMI
MAGSDRRSNRGLKRSDWIESHDILLLDTCLKFLLSLVISPEFWKINYHIKCILYCTLLPTYLPTFISTVGKYCGYNSKRLPRGRGKFVLRKVTLYPFPRPHYL